ncbi:4-hydroxy-3-methylbut-2-enyl diphosphate reductase [Actinokineospora iranica]|uniref:4-hydroxy-3-methylbut-2-enyl diphosphate reductase n=1 Tax=Actinokineospora iranica TaxID=1271860 RepID=A0A1G6VUK7_9PSEU|nr:4-hydroxy-3-methylbut-2-enyl diphosphate reductase [Actinokineospora iranica]
MGVIPPSLVDEVVAALDGLGAITVESRRVATETVEFALPRKVSS